MRAINSDFGMIKRVYCRECGQGIEFEAENASPGLAVVCPSCSYPVPLLALPPVFPPVESNETWDHLQESMAVDQRQARNVRVIALWLAIGLGCFFHFLFMIGGHSSQPQEEGGFRPLDPQALRAGNSVYNLLRSRDPEIKLDALLGAGVGPAVLTVAVRLHDWEGLTAQQRHDLSVYVSSFIPAARANPRAYIPSDIPSTAPGFPLLEANVRRCTTWRITDEGLNPLLSGVR